MSHANTPPEAANHVGAVSLAIADRIRIATESVARHSSAGPAALVCLHEFLHDAGPSDLYQVVDLTPSGAVRLVDRLEADGLVERRPATDARAVRLGLTAKGKAAARSILAERRAALADVLKHLTADEQEQLGRLSAKVLAGLANDRATARRLCRLCDTDACGHYTGSCPVTNAVNERTRESAASGR